MALDDTALGDLALDPRLLDRIGILDSDGRIILRQLPDLLLRFFRLMKPLGGKTDIVLGQSHAGVGREKCKSWSKKAGCGNMINMLNGSRQTELGFAAVQTRRGAEFI
jgi:hypothetical protein